MWTLVRKQGVQFPRQPWRHTGPLRSGSVRQSALGMERASPERTRALFDAGGATQSGAVDGGVPRKRGVFVAETKLVEVLQAHPRKPIVLKAPDGKQLTDNKMPKGFDGEPLRPEYVGDALAGVHCRSTPRRRMLQRLRRCVTACTVPALIVSALPLPYFLLCVCVLWCICRCRRRRRHFRDLRTLRVDPDIEANRVVFAEADEVKSLHHVPLPHSQSSDVVKQVAARRKQRHDAALAVWEQERKQLYDRVEERVCALPVRVCLCQCVYSCVCLHLVYSCLCVSCLCVSVSPCLLRVEPLSSLSHTHTHAISLSMDISLPLYVRV